MSCSSRAALIITSERTTSFQNLWTQIRTHRHRVLKKKQLVDSWKDDKNNNSCAFCRLFPKHVGLWLAGGNNFFFFSSSRSLCYHQNLRHMAYVISHSVQNIDINRKPRVWHHKERFVT